jgi:1-acyl-sn-glycerol-3-phosphate acyltransferase
MLRSTLFNIYFLLITLLLWVIGIPLLFLSSYYSVIGCRMWGYGVVYGAKYIAGIKFEIKGTIPTTPCIIASKHQSAWETAFFWLVFKHNCFVLKKELMYIPFLGLYLWRAKQIWLNRSKGASSIKKLLAQSKKRISEGSTIIIFPEGTRTKPGTKPNYKPGIATIYNGVDAPIVPVRLNSGTCWLRSAFIKKPGTITVEFLEPLPSGLTKQEFMKELEAKIEGK